MKKLFYITVALFLPANYAFAASEAVDASQVGKLFGGLIVVVAVIFWGAWLAKKFSIGNSFSNNGSLKIVSMLSLGTREKIVLVEVGDEQFVIGTSAQGIQHLHTLKQPIKLDDNKPKHPASFSEQLKNLLVKPKSSNKSSNSIIDRNNTDED